jgi:bifunctional DNA-binding transcriptional regulator/antitoxin component of YhaV-PrlF toxin-antitoxin module
MSKLRMEDVVCIEETAITVRGYRRRTTVPSKIFKFMELSEGDALRWIAMRDGTIFVTKVEHKKTKVMRK